MKKSFFGADGLLGKMVVSMPSVAIEVLNKCARETKKAHEIELEYDFFALQTTGIFTRSIRRILFTKSALEINRYLVL